MTKTETKRTFEPLDELRYKAITSARLSPDGKQVVYALKENDIEKETISTQLWLVDLDTGLTKQLTYGDKNNTSPEWSPDGKKILFRSDRSKKNQVYILSASGGEAQQLTEFKQGIGGDPVWSPDGQYIAFTAGPDEEPPDPTKPYRVTRFVYRFDGVGFLHNAVQNIYIVPAAGGEPKQLTKDDEIDHSLQWSPDSKEILYQASWDPEMSNLFSAKIRTVDLEGEMDEIVGLDWGISRGVKWGLDGTKIYFNGTTGDFPMGAKVDLWVVDRAGGEPVNLTQGLKWGFGYSVGLILDENTALMNLGQNGMIDIYAVSLTGEPGWKQLLGGERGTALQDANDNHMLYLSGDLENPGELYIANLDGTEERAITQVNKQLVADIAFPKVEHLLFTNDEGIQIEGWLLVPVKGEAPYPTILYIHGGPHGAYGYQYRSDFQMLAGAGYAVLFTNPRGSRGYGDEFSTVLSGNWGVMDYKDLMAGVDHVIEKGFADPDKLGVCGLSYGGFLTTFTVGQTNRFKAAVAENPITDLVSRYGTADMGPWGSISELGGKPHEVPEVYRRGSPITYAHNCTTPTLLVQGEMDYRCPAGQSEQFYTTLKANGCVAEMLRLPNMPHVGSITGPIIVQKAQNDALLDWMNRYVLDKSIDEQA